MATKRRSTGKKAPKKTKEPKRYLTDEEAKKVAHDMVGNLIFCTDQLKRPEDITMTFMILGMLNKEQLDKYTKEDVVHFYEYLSKKLPMAVNGYPCFFSCRALTRSDYSKVREYETKIREALAKV
jgi:hypothetical protein